MGDVAAHVDARLTPKKTMKKEEPLLAAIAALQVLACARAKEYIDNQRQPNCRCGEPVSSHVWLAVIVMLQVLDLLITGYLVCLKP